MYQACLRNNRKARIIEADLLLIFLLCGCCTERLIGPFCVSSAYLCVKDAFALTYKN